MNILSLKFACETSCVINQDMHKKITLNIQNPFYISKLSLLLYSRGGKWTEEYYLLSERPFSMIPNYEEGGLRVIRVLSKENVIILPAQDNTDRWINQIFSGVVIPQYPKVAYQSKDHLT